MHVLALRLAWLAVWQGGAQGWYFFFFVDHVGCGVWSEPLCWSLHCCQKHGEAEVGVIAAHWFHTGNRFLGQACSSGCKKCLFTLSDLLLSRNWIPGCRQPCKPWERSWREENRDRYLSGNLRRLRFLQMPVLLLIFLAAWGKSWSTKQVCSSLGTASSYLASWCDASWRRTRWCGRECSAYSSLHFACFRPLQWGGRRGLNAVVGGMPL